MTYLVAARSARLARIKLRRFHTDRIITGLLPVQFPTTWELSRGPRPLDVTPRPAPAQLVFEVNGRAWRDAHWSTRRGLV